MSKDASEADLRRRYRELISNVLPAEIDRPIRFDHCFARVVLDWLFEDVWYGHVDRPAYANLTADQLRRCIDRMERWREDREVLVRDNSASKTRRRLKKAADSTR